MPTTEPTIAHLNSVDVFTLCKDSARYQGYLALSQLPRLQSDLRTTDGTVSYMISGETNSDNQALLSLVITGVLPVNCQRCAEGLDYALNVDNVLQLVYAEAQLDSEEEELNAILEGRAGIEKIVGSHSFDILSLLEDEIILSLPVVIAHDACPTKLPHSVGDKQNAFSALAGLKKGK